jgi:hypothetical protein
VTDLKRNSEIERWVADVAAGLEVGPADASAIARAVIAAWQLTDAQRETVAQHRELTEALRTRVDSCELRIAALTKNLVRLSEVNTELGLELVDRMIGPRVTCPGNTFYVASSRDGLCDVETLAGTLQAAGWRNAFDWPSHFSHACSEETCGIRDRKELARRELDAAGSCGLFVGIGRLGKGSHVELGAALRGPARIILVGIDPSDSVFYTADRVEYAENLRAAVDLIRLGPGHD